MKSSAKTVRRNPISLAGYESIAPAHKPIVVDYVYHYPAEEYGDAMAAQPARIHTETYAIGGKWYTSIDKNGHEYNDYGHPSKLKENLRDAVPDSGVAARVIGTKIMAEAKKRSAARKAMLTANPARKNPAARRGMTPKAYHAAVERLIAGGKYANDAVKPGASVYLKLPSQEVVLGKVRQVYGPAEPGDYLEGKHRRAIVFCGGQQYDWPTMDLVVASGTRANPKPLRRNRATSDDVPASRADADALAAQLEAEAAPLAEAVRHNQGSARAHLYYGLGAAARQWGHAYGIHGANKLELRRAKACMARLPELRAAAQAEVADLNRLRAKFAQRANPSAKSQRKAVRKGMDPVKHAGGSPYTRADDRIERDGQAWEYRGEVGNAGTARAAARDERLDTGRKTLVIQRGPFVGTLFGTPTRFHVWTVYAQEGTALHGNPGRRKKNPVTHGDDVMKPYNWQKKEDEYQGAGSRKLHEWATEAIATRDSADAEAKRAEDARVVSSRELEMAKERYAPLELSAKNAYQVYSWHADDASTIGMEKRRAAERLKKTKEWAESELAEMHMNPRKGRATAKRRNPLPGPDALQGLKAGDKIRITTDLSDRVSTYTVVSKRFGEAKVENDMSGGKATIEEDSVDLGTLVIHGVGGTGRVLTLQRVNGNPRRKIRN